VRASGTEPLRRVRVEAASPAEVDHWAGLLAGLAESQLNGG
jgi:phosphomannomutase